MCSFPLGAESEPATMRRGRALLVLRVNLVQAHPPELVFSVSQFVDVTLLDVILSSV
jgi:hypothetical protein